MAEFCSQCSIKIFGEDFGELAGISLTTDTDSERYALVLCEECGPTQVDHYGVCIDHDKHPEEKE